MWVLKGSASPLDPTVEDFFPPQVPAKIAIYLRKLTLTIYNNQK